MECEKVKELLSAYIDSELLPEEKTQIEEHLASCASCREELALLEQYAKQMLELPRVRPPDDFLQKVNERIERRSQFESVVKGFFKPSAVKTKAFVMVASVVVMIAVYKVIAPQLTVYRPEVEQEKRVLEDKAAGNAVQEEKLAVLEEKMHEFKATAEKAQVSVVKPQEVPVKEYKAVAPVVADGLKMAEPPEAKWESPAYTAIQSGNEQRFAVSKGVEAVAVDSGLISSEQALSIAGSTRQAKDFLKSFPNAKTKVFMTGGCDMAWQVNGKAVLCTEEIDKLAWVVVYYRKDPWQPSDTSALKFGIDASTGKILARSK